MCKAFALVALCVTFSFLETLAQKPPLKFGDVSTEELKMSQYAPDSAAAAVVLCDYGESDLKYDQNQGFYLVFERLTRIKILTRDGYDEANFQIPLYTGQNEYREKLSGLKVVTYNLVDGKVKETKASDDAVFQEAYNENYDIVKVAAPEIREGSVVEITYKITTASVHNLQDWAFQSTIPVVWSEYRAHIPDFFNYERYMQGYITAATHEEKYIPRTLTLQSKSRDFMGGTSFQQDRIDYKEYYLRLAAKDVPAFKEEPYLTTYKDYISKINFELAYVKFPNRPIEPVLGTWEEINKKLWEHSDFGGQLKGNAFLGKIVESVTAGASTPDAKIAAIHDYVRTNIEWNGRNRIFAQSSLKKVLDEGKGSCADINLTMACMLAKAGFTVFPVILSTRDNGFVRDNFPLLSQFNYTACAVVVEGKHLVLDATRRSLPAGVLPRNCLNGKGFLISGQGGSWIDLNPTVKSRSVVSVELNFDEDGEANYSLNRVMEGYYGYESRASYLDKGEEAYVKSFLGGRAWNIKEKNFEDTEDITKPFRERYEIVAQDDVEGTEEVLYIDPMLMNAEKENPFKLEKREYPVDFGHPFERVLTFKLKVPAGYQVDELPKAKLLMLPGNTARYAFNTTVNGDVVTVTSILSINKAIYTQLEYPNLREFYNQVVATQSGQIILKKI
ncbi:MAG TPA: transglutaminase domain-containing protein [Cyclobacteriaceae bacterium]